MYLVKFQALLFLVITTRILGADGFGILALALSVFEMSHKIALMGLPNTVQRFIAGGGDQNRAYYGAVLMLASIGAIVFSGVLFFAGSLISKALFGNQDLGNILPWFGLILLITVPVQIFSAVMRSQGYMKQAAILNIINSMGRLIFVLVFAFLGSLLGVMLAISLAAIMQLLFGILYIRRVKLRPDFFAGCSVIPKVFSYSLPLLVAGFGYFKKVHQTDRLMLGYYGYTAGLGQYVAVNSIILNMGSFYYFSLYAIRGTCLSVKRFK